MRQQGLVSNLRADNLRLRADRERLRKENQELRKTLTQINSVTLGLQYWLDGGFEDKGGCVLDNKIGQTMGEDGSPEESP